MLCVCVCVCVQQYLCNKYDTGSSRYQKKFFHRTAGVPSQMFCHNFLFVPLVELEDISASLILYKICKN